jgi:hypothetical protein
MRAKIDWTNYEKDRKMIATMAKKVSKPLAGKIRETFVMPPDLYDALERYLASLRPSPDKSTVYRVAIEDFLTDKGFWPTEEK